MPASALRLSAYAPCAQEEKSTGRKVCMMNVEDWEESTISGEKLSFLPNNVPLLPGGMRSEKGVLSSGT